MFVCSCAVITDKDIKTAIRGLRSHGYTQIDRDMVYAWLDKVPSCGSCSPLMAKILEEARREGLHVAEIKVPQLQLEDGDTHEGQRQGY